MGLSSGSIFCHCETNPVWVICSFFLMQNEWHRHHPQQHLMLSFCWDPPEKQIWYWPVRWHHFRTVSVMLSQRFGSVSQVLLVKLKCHSWAGNCRCDSRQVKSRQVKGTEEPSSSYQRTTVRAGLKSTKLKDEGKGSLNTWGDGGCRTGAKASVWELVSSTHRCAG